MFSFLHKVKVLEFKVELLEKKLQNQEMMITSLIDAVKTSNAVLNSVVNPKPVSQSISINKSYGTKTVKPFPSEKIKTTEFPEGNHVNSLIEQSIPAFVDTTDYTSSSCSSDTSPVGGCD